MRPPVQGERALLFERLEDTDPWRRPEAVPLRVLHGRALMESVRREVEDLLNTRCTLLSSTLAGRERTTLEYGLQDITGLEPANPDARREIAARIERAVAAYEPRLRGVRATIEPVPGRPRELWAHLDGLLVTERVPAPVSFTVAVGARAAGRESS